MKHARAMLGSLILAAAAAWCAACGGMHCDGSVAAYCAEGGCPASPETATATLCEGTIRVFEKHCGGYVVVDQAGDDTGTDYYFDADSGALVATIEWSANFGGSRECSSGPGSFDPPDCPEVKNVQLPCPDAGFL